MSHDLFLFLDQNHYFYSMKQIILFLFFVPFIINANTVSGKYTIPAVGYHELFVITPPFSLSYTVTVLGGAQSGTISTFLVDDTNYGLIANGDYINAKYVVSGSRMNTVEAVVNDFYVGGDIPYHLVVINNNLLLSLDVNATATATPVNSSIGGGLIALIVIICVCCCGVVIGGCFFGTKKYRQYQVKVRTETFYAEK